MADAKVIPVMLNDKNEIYHSFMSYVNNGGLFIPTKDTYELGEEVFLLLCLMEETEKITVGGEVVWVTPRGAQGGMSAGIGVQFTSEDAMEVRNKIENYLAGMSTDSSTGTM